MQEELCGSIKTPDCFGFVVCFLNKQWPTGGLDFAGGLLAGQLEPMQSLISHNAGCANSEKVRQARNRPALCWGAGRVSW